MLSAVFLGLSHWHAPMHVLAARRAGMTVIGGFDADRTLARAWASREGATAFDTIDAALGAGPSLAVVTGTPDEMPGRVTAAMDRGVPLLVEKPLATQTDLIESLARRAARESRFAAVAFPHRLSPAIHDPATSPPAGTVRHFGFRLVNGPPQRYRDWGAGWVLDAKKGGGGALRNLGLHGLDAARALLGEDLTVTGAAMRHWCGEAVEDHAVVTLATASGATVTIEVGYLHPDPAGSDFEVRLVRSDQITIETGDALRRVGADGIRHDLAPSPLRDRYDLMMADLAHRLHAGRPPLASLDDLVAAMKLADDAYRCAGAT